MNWQKNRYTLLMASLTPHEPQLFAHKQPLVSVYQLNKRLAWLHPDDAEQLDNIRRILDWSAVNDLADTGFIQAAQYLLDTLDNTFLRNIVSWRLELRTLVAAVRHKHHQPEQAMKPEYLLMTKFGRDILSNWQLDDFGLRYRFPWLLDVNQWIQQQRYWQLERFLLNLAWQYYDRQSQGHYFDFEAVVIYVLRWELRQRLNLYDGQKARQRFVELLERQVV
jgi:hypothetical protein